MWQPAILVVTLLVSIVAAKEIILESNSGDGQRFVDLDRISMEGMGRIMPIHVVNESALVVLSRKAESIVNAADQHWSDIPVGSIGERKNCAVDFFLADGRAEILSKFLIGKQRHSRGMFVRHISAHRIAEFFLPIYGLEKLTLFKGIGEHLSLDINPLRYGMPDVFDRNSQFQVRSSFAVKLEGTSYAQPESYPRTCRQFKLLLSCFHAVRSRLGRSLSCLGSLFHFTPLESGEGSVGDEHSKTDYFRSKLYVIEPISLFLPGRLMLGWRWWRLKFSRCWRDWWLGLIAMLIGWPLGSLGLGLSIARVF